MFWFSIHNILLQYHPMVILAHFNFFILKLHQRNVYNRHLLLFVTSEGKMQRRSRQYTTMHCGFGPLYTYYQFAGAARSVFVGCRCKHISENLSF